MRLLTVLSALLALFFIQALDAQHLPPMDGCLIRPCSDVMFPCPKGFVHSGDRRCKRGEMGLERICCPAKVTAAPREPDSADG